MATFLHPEWARAIYQAIQELGGGEIPVEVQEEAYHVVQDFPMAREAAR